MYEYYRGIPHMLPVGLHGGLPGQHPLASAYPPPDYLKTSALCSGFPSPPGVPGIAFQDGIYGGKPDPRIKVKLENADIWKQFHQFGTEMIITKTGRRMFPTIKITVSGLEANVKYFVLMDVVLSTDSRYKFQNKEWVAAGKAEPHVPGRLYIHPHSPASGSQWMRHSISFEKLKITNNNLDQQGHIILCSMHKYLPRIHIVAANDLISLHWSPFNTFSFTESQFLAVTAYQNEKITQLKIDHNPFAKGFRENGHTKPKKRQDSISPSACPITSSTEKMSEESTFVSVVDTDVDHDLSDSENRPSSCMSVENDTVDISDKIDVEDTPVSCSLFTSSAAPSSYMASPSSTTSAKTTARSSVDHSEVSKGSSLDPIGGDVTLPSHNPFLSSHPYSHMMPPANPFNYSYLYYSHMVPPYLLGNSPALARHSPFSCSSASDKPTMSSIHSPFLRLHSNHATSLSSNPPARPSPIYPYFSFPAQLTAHL